MFYEEEEISVTKELFVLGYLVLNEMYQNEYVKENLWPVEQGLDGFSLLEKCIRWPFMKTRSHIVRDMRSAILLCKDEF